MDYKNIGDTLTVKEFNGIISLLRDNVKFNEKIRINNSSVIGNYGKYSFNFHEATVLDNGILITDETLSSIGTILLTEPVFPNSNYYIDLKVYSSKEVGDEVIVTNLTVKLDKENPVNVPFETLNMNNIISFDAIIRIDHKDLVFRGESRILLRARPSELEWGNPVKIEAKYVDGDSTPIPDAEIKLYRNDVFIDNFTTDSKGLISFTEKLDKIGEYNYLAMHEQVTGSVKLLVIKRQPVISLSADHTSTYAGDTVTMTGNLRYGEDSVAGVNIDLYNGSELIDTVTTDDEGNFTGEVVASSDLSLHASFNGNELYNPVKSDNIIIPMVSSSIRMSADPTVLEWGNSVKITCAYFDENNNPIPDIEIKLYRFNELIYTAMTDKQGLISFEEQLDKIGEYIYRAKHNQVEGSVEVEVTKKQPVISLSADRTSSYIGDTVTLSGNLKYNKTMSIVNVPIELYNGSQLITTVTTDDKGDFTGQVTVESDLSLLALFDGNELYKSAKSNNIVIPVLTPVITLTVEGAEININDNPFTYTGEVIINYGDGVTEKYSGGAIKHTYSKEGSYTIRVFGNITALNQQAFQEGEFWLIGVTLDNRITGIGVECFNNCFALKTVDLGNNVKSLGTGAFQNCNKLTTVKLGDSLETIGDECFMYCEKLSSLNLPITVKSIGYRCFYDCLALNDLYLNWINESDIIRYEPNWTVGSNISKFHIPAYTTDRYIARDYPANLLVSEGVYDILVTGKSTGVNNHILSDIDKDVLTLTCKAVYENQEGVTGATIKFYKNNELIATGTTDKNGEASIKYESAHKGEVIFSIQEETGGHKKEYIVEDCVDNEPMTTNRSQKHWQVPAEVASSSIFGYNNDGWSFGMTESDNIITWNLRLYAGYSVEFTLTDFKNDISPAPSIYLWDQSEQYLKFDFNQDNITTNYNLVAKDGSPVKNAVYKIEMTSNYVRLYENNNKIYELNTGLTPYNFPMRVEYHTGKERMNRIKDFKVKPI